MNDFSCWKVAREVNYRRSEGGFKQASIIKNLREKSKWELPNGTREATGTLKHKDIPLLCRAKTSSCVNRNTGFHGGFVTKENQVLASHQSVTYHRSFRNATGRDKLGQHRQCQLEISVSQDPLLCFTVCRTSSSAPHNSPSS